MVQGKEAENIKKIKIIKDKLRGGGRLSPDTFTPIIPSYKNADRTADKPDFKELSKDLGGVKLEKLQEVFDAEIIGNKPGKTRSADVFSNITSVIDNANRRFKESFDSLPSYKNMLLAQTSNTDHICRLEDDQSAQKKIDAAFQDALKEGKELGKDPGEVIKEIEAIIYEETDLNNLPKFVKTKAEVIGFILRMFKYGGGGRKLIVDMEGREGSAKKLAEWIGKTFVVKKGDIKTGGAAAQLADFLSGIGETNATLYTEFNSPEQAASYKHSPKFLRVTGDEFKIDSVENSVNVNDPVRINYPIERVASLSVTFNGKKINATDESDRMIFLNEYYGKDGQAVDFNPLLNFSPILLGKIAKHFEYFFTTGPNSLQRFSKEKYDEIAPKMADELRILKTLGVKVLYEFSGSTTGVQYFKDVLRGNISSISINHDRELIEVIRSIKNEIEPDIAFVDDNSPYGIYKNAVALGKYLGVERVHVHGHNSDIVIRLNASTQDLENEVNGLFYAKQRVTEWIQGKESRQITPPKELPMALLKREGYEDILQFADDLAEALPDESPYFTLGKYSLYHRNINIDEARAELRHSIFKKGYYKKNGGYSVVMVPVKWVYDEAKITTSSGDIISMIAAIHAWINHRVLKFPTSTPSQ